MLRLPGVGQKGTSNNISIKLSWYLSRYQFNLSSRSASCLWWGKELFLFPSPHAGWFTGRAYWILITSPRPSMAEYFLNKDQQAINQNYPTQQPSGTCYTKQGCVIPGKIFKPQHPYYLSGMWQTPLEIFWNTVIFSSVLDLSSFSKSTLIDTLYRYSKVLLKGQNNGFAALTSAAEQSQATCPSNPQLNQEI